MVATRSRRFGIVRVAMMPGNRAGKARQQRDERATREAHAAHQPVEQDRRRAAGNRCPRASRMKKNRIRICGRKTSTLPMPARSRRRPAGSEARPSGQRAVHRTGRAPRCLPSISAIGTAAQLNTAWKHEKQHRGAGSASPATGCITIASSWRSARVPDALRRSRSRCRIRRTSRCVRSISRKVGLMPLDGTATQRAAARLEPLDRWLDGRRRVPPRRSRPRARRAPRSSAAPSTSNPRDRARSLMLSATIIGHADVAAAPSARVADCRRRLVASTTHDDEVRCGLPGQTSEQQVAGDRLVERGQASGVQAPGRSSTLVEPRREGPTNMPSLRSTVTLGVVGDLCRLPVRRLKSAVLPLFGDTDQRKLKCDIDGGSMHAHAGASLFLDVDSSPPRPRGDGAQTPNFQCERRLGRPPARSLSDHLDPPRPGRSRVRAAAG